MTVAAGLLRALELLRLGNLANVVVVSKLEIHVVRLADRLELRMMLHVERRHGRVLARSPARRAVTRHTFGIRRPGKGRRAPAVFPVTGAAGLLAVPGRRATKVAGTIRVVHGE